MRIANNALKAGISGKVTFIAKFGFGVLKM